MKLEDLFSSLLDTFKVPETLEEAINYINTDPSMQSLVEEMSFRQVVINVLVAANIISEKDFNESVKYFKTLFTKSFAEELLSKIDNFNFQYSQDKELDNQDEDDPEDELPPGKEYYDA